MGKTLPDVGQLDPGNPHPPLPRAGVGRVGLASPIEQPLCRVRAHPADRRVQEREWIV